MTTPTRVFAALLATATFVVVGAASAGATPDSPAWPDAPARSTLDGLILFGGGTVGLFVVISLLALLTARNNFVPEPGTELEISAHH